jgi:ribonuclease HI
MALTIHFDGLCLPKNPGGVATYGFVAKRGAKVVHEEAGLAATPYSPEATNNVAEYTGILKALEWAHANGLSGETLVVRGDSELVIRQLKGEYKVKSASIVDLFKQVRELITQFTSISLQWIPREKNREADALTNRAYAEFMSRGAAERKREDDSARVTRGFSIEIDVAGSVTAALRVLKMPGTTVEPSNSPGRIALKHGDGGRGVVTVTALKDGARVRVEYSRPAADEDAGTLQSAERAWHAALLALQSRLEGGVS